MGEELPDLVLQVGGALPHEAGADRFGPLHLEGVGGVEEHGEGGVVLAGPVDEVDPGVVRKLAAAGDGHVAHHRQEARAVTLQKLESLLVRGGVQDLRPRLRVHLAQGLVDPLAVKRASLAFELFEKDSQERRIIRRRVFDHEDHLDVPVLDVVIHVAAVFHVLDGGEQDLRVAVPQKGSVDHLRIDLVSQLVELLAVEGEEHHGASRGHGLDPAAEVVDVAVDEAGHGDHEIEIAPAEQLQRRGAGGHVGEPRRGRKAEVAVFEQQALGEPAVLPQDEGVVG